MLNDRATNPGDRTIARKQPLENESELKLIRNFGTAPRTGRAPAAAVAGTQFHIPGKV